MTTEAILKLAVELAGLKETPVDSGVQVPGTDIKKVLIGIDMETPELILAKDMGYDLVISHHPNAEAQRVDFYQVMDRQIDKMVSFGVPINRAQKALEGRKLEVAMASHVANYNRNSSAAKLMGMPFMNIHMPADIIGEDFIQDYLDSYTKDKPKATCGDLIDALNELPIYKNACAGPIMRAGSKDSYAGKVAVLYAGGTNGGVDVFKSYFDAGVGTIVCMHVPANVRKAVLEQNIGNIIVAGHMASDSIGLNKIIEALQEKGLEVTKMSGIL